MTDHRREEAEAIREMTEATDDLRNAWRAVMFKQVRMGAGDASHGNPTENEMERLDNAMERFETAQLNMHRISEEIKSGKRP